MGRAKRGQSSGQLSVSRTIIPEEESDYYDALERKHFSDQAAGSRFRASSLREVLEAHPGLLEQKDDREEFIRLGVPPEALLPGRSYFLIRSPGEEGMISADDLPADKAVRISREKPGSLSFLVRGDRQPTNIGTAIVGDYPRDPSRRALITIFPGLPADPGRSSVAEENDLGLEDGQEMTLSELQKRTGRKDLLLQVSPSG
jgi:hypothetical protein